MSGAWVLVLDGHSGAGLSVVRSLGRRGLQVTVGAPEGQPALGRRSRYARRRFVYPDPMRDEAGFVAAVEAELERRPYALLIPTTEDSVIPLDRVRERLSERVCLAIAPREALAVALDKARTFALAAELGVPVPAGRRVEDAAALARAAEALSYPVVLKPVRSIACPEGGERQRTQVSYAQDPEALLKLGAAQLRRGPLILQAYAQGLGVGIELLADHGEVVYAFAHQRHHELPLTGGGSCLRESVAVPPELLRDSAQLMRALNWHGVAMVEFKWDPERRQACLMEINGRFWGSLPLAVAAGADFPGFLFDLLVHGRRPSAPPARLGVFCRKLMDDVYWHVQVLRPTDDNPLIRYPSRQEVLTDLLRGQPFAHHLDVQQLSDPLPGLLDAWRTARWFGQRVQAVLQDRRRARAVSRRRGDPALRAQLGRAHTLLLLCYGNINRSAAVAPLIRAALPEADPLQLRSAGFHHPEGRPADPQMCAVAAAQGLDLSAHRSRTVDAALVAEAQLILVMELRHRDRLIEAFPEAAPKTWLLSQLGDDPELPLEVADPYGLGEQAYARCLDQLRRAAQLLADLRAQASPA